MHARRRETPALAGCQPVNPVVDDLSRNGELIRELGRPMAPPVRLEEPVEGHESPGRFETDPALGPWALAASVPMLYMDQLVHECTAPFYVVEPNIEPYPRSAVR